MDMPSPPSHDAVRAALRRADFDQQMRVVYQPIVELATGRVSGFEALLRWENGALGEVSPAVFIPIAERAGLVPEIGRWVLGRTCHQIEQWSGVGLATDLWVSCNVSPLHLQEADFVDQISSVLNQFPSSQGRLVVEVTESVVLDTGFEIDQKLAQLRQLGVRVAIDDFGSGYSNLGRLPKMPFDTIKIDYSLLSSLRDWERAQTAPGLGGSGLRLIEMVVSIAGVFGAAVVCEGVETIEEREVLRQIGVTYAQGYLTGRPGTVHQAEVLLEHRI